MRSAFHANPQTDEQILLKRTGAFL